MDSLYHGCYYKNADGTNWFIAPRENRILRTNKCFWKDPCDIVSGVKMRSFSKNEQCASFSTVDKYYKDNEIKIIDSMSTYI